MVAAVRVHKVGGPEVLTYEDIPVPAAGPGQIRVKQHAIGVNFVDTYFRSGLYPAPGGLPFVAGNEAAGEVVEVGAGVSELKPGDRVAYVQGPGCYTAERVVPADRAVKLPANISYEQAAGMMLKGLTVQYLVRRTFKVEKGMNVLMHAAAGGVGLILCQWANHLGANVIGTVGSKEKAELAKANGCHHTILYRNEDFVARVKDITGGKLCDVVYDGIGKTTFPASLDCIRPLGMFVSFGSASRPISAFDINLLQFKGSLFATRPTLNTYAAKRADLGLATFAWLRAAPCTASLRSSTLAMGTRVQLLVCGKVGTPFSSVPSADCYLDHSMFPAWSRCINAPANRGHDTCGMQAYLYHWSSLAKAGMEAMVRGPAMMTWPRVTSKKRRPQSGPSFCRGTMLYRSVPRRNAFGVKHHEDHSCRDDQTRRVS